MASTSKAPILTSTKMPIPPDDRRDEQFHLDITKKNTAACYGSSKPK